MDENWLLESLQTGLQDLEKIVKAVQTLLNDQHEAGGENEDPLTTESGEDILVENHASVLNSTVLVVHELQQITMACMKQGKSKLAVPPLDPMLHEWIFTCSANVMRIQKAIQLLRIEEVGSEVVEESNVSGDEWLLVEDNGGEMGDIKSDGGMAIEDTNTTNCSQGEPSAVVDLGLEFKSLKERTTCIAEFIPILKFQIDEFLSENVSRTQFPDSTTIERRTRGDGNFSIHQDPSSPNTSLQDLRTLLYNLSDETKFCRTSLSSLASSPTLPIDVLADTNGLIAAVEVSVKILAELLSNNASEWIDSMLAGKLSFSEFSALDQEELEAFVRDLRGLSLHLRRVLQDRARGRVNEVGSGLDVEEMELGMWLQRIKGLNWMLGDRDLT